MHERRRFSAIDGAHCPAARRSNQLIRRSRERLVESPFAVACQPTGARAAEGPDASTALMKGLVPSVFFRPSPDFRPKQTLLHFRRAIDFAVLYFIATGSQGPKFLAISLRYHSIIGQLLRGSFLTKFIKYK
jgi:hypothetical protein